MSNSTHPEGYYESNKQATDVYTEGCTAFKQGHSLVSSPYYHHPEWGPHVGPRLERQRATSPARCRVRRS